MAIPCRLNTNRSFFIVFYSSSGAADASLGLPLQHTVGCTADGFLEPFFKIFIFITSFAVWSPEAYADSPAILRTASRTMASIPSFSQSRE